MTASRDITLWCDDPECEEWTTFGAGANTVAITRRLAKGVGWRFRNGQDFCPKHSRAKP